MNLEWIRDLAKDITLIEGAVRILSKGYIEVKRVLINLEPKKLDNALEKLEVAITETHSYISCCDTQTPNRSLEGLWKEASSALKNVEGLEKATGIAFEKQLYWQNPKYYRGENPEKIDKIKLVEVKEILTDLRKSLKRANK